MDKQKSETCAKESQKRPTNAKEKQQKGKTRAKKTSPCMSVLPFFFICVGLLWLFCACSAFSRVVGFSFFNLLVIAIQLKKAC